MTRTQAFRCGIRVALGALFLTVAAAASAQTDAVRPAGGQQEGIKVHGDWTIEIRNADGTLASRHEFRNHLATGSTDGSALLAGILANFYTGHQLQINLEGSTTANRPCELQGQPFQCQIVDPSFGAAQPGFRFNTLAIAVPITNNDYASGAVELTGHATAARDGVVGKVLTVVHVQKAGTGFYGPLSLTTRDVNVPVTAGQIVQVRVLLSFS